MKKDEIQFAKALFDATIGLVPGGNAAKGFAAPLFERMLATSDIASIEQASKKQAAEIRAYFMALQDSGLINPGSGHAAAADFAAIISKARITPRLLIDLDLDTEKLWQYLLDIGKEELAEASQGRLGRVRQALREYAAEILNVAAELPSVRLEFMRAMLRRLPLAAPLPA